MPRERSTARSVTFGLLVACLVFALLEGFSWMMYGCVASEPYAPGKVSARRRELIAIQPDRASPAAALQKYVPHPYLGYVMNPEIGQATEATDWWIRSDGDPFESPPEARHVVVVGGSVAFNMRRSGDRLIASLREIPAYRDRPLRLVTLAGLGHKAPQQLLAVAYFVALGGRIDLLINLDGFNEIGTEIDRNLRQGVNPSYPSFWSQVTRDLGSASELQSLGEIVFIRRARASLAEVVEHFRWSATANLSWFLVDRRFEAAIQARIGRDFEIAAGPVYSRGPPFPGSPKEAREFAIRLWRDESLALHRLAAGYGFQYFHFLQPNQYVPDSKRSFTTVEREKYASRESFRRIVGRWYPELQAAGAELKNQGVPFFDLSAIFRDVEITVYNDSCCHLNDDGRNLLVESIASVVAEQLAARRPARD